MEQDTQQQDDTQQQKSGHQKRTEAGRAVEDAGENAAGDILAGGARAGLSPSQCLTILSVCDFHLRDLHAWGTDIGVSDKEEFVLCRTEAERALQESRSSLQNGERVKEIDVKRLQVLVHKTSQVIRNLRSQNDERKTVRTAWESPSNLRGHRNKNGEDSGKKKMHGKEKGLARKLHSVRNGHEINSRYFRQQYENLKDEREGHPYLSHWNRVHMKSLRTRSTGMASASNDARPAWDGRVAPKSHPKVPMAYASGALRETTSGEANMRRSKVNTLRNASISPIRSNIAQVGSGNASSTFIGASLSKRSVEEKQAYLRNKKAALYRKPLLATHLEYHKEHLSHRARRNDDRIGDKTSPHSEPWRSW
eukprot:g4042.t1